MLLSQNFNQFLKVDIEVDSVTLPVYDWKCTWNPNFHETQNDYTIACAINFH